MLWELEIRPKSTEVDREGLRVLAGAKALGAGTIGSVRSARSYLIEGEIDERSVTTLAQRLLADAVVEDCTVRRLPDRGSNSDSSGLLNVLFKPGVTDNVGETARMGLADLGLPADRVATCRKYWVDGNATDADVLRLSQKVLSNDAIEHVVRGPLKMDSIGLGSSYRFELRHTAIRTLNDDQLMKLSKEGQLYLQLAEMRKIRDYFRELDRDPTDIELETVAQTWSEHCSHKTLGGRIAYRDENGERRFENMLKETVFAATQTIRKQLGTDDWCVSVFKDNAGVVTFDEEYDICIKVETHNHPSALEPYGGANTGLGGVIRDPLGTGLGAKPICNTDVFCFAPPDTPYDALPPGVLHPKTVMQGVVSGVRDYGNRMGIPTVNGAVYFDERYIGNPLVYCGNVAMIPRGMSVKKVEKGDHIVAVGGRTGRDGIHGATFSSAELTHESEELSGGAVQIGNAITEKMVMDVILEARDRKLFHAITDCGAGGFSSAVGEMGEETGAEVWLEKAPLKYSGLSYTEIWISEAQERMVLAVPPTKWDEFHQLCASEGVEASVIGQFTDTHRLVLKYDGQLVGELTMEFLHEGRPPVVREAVYQGGEQTAQGQGGGSQKAEEIASTPSALSPQPSTHPLPPSTILRRILASLNVCSKEWIIRQYDHEVQAGSVVKPLVGVCNDGPSDAAVVRPRLNSNRGAVIACGMNPRYGDLDPYWMAAAAIDEAVRNAICVGANPDRIAILDNFCWGNTERPETLGSLVRAALGCHDTAIAFGTPFVSGKDSLNNNYTYEIDDLAPGVHPLDRPGALRQRTITIPSSLLITALGQIDDIESAVTMDLKERGNLLFLIGATKNELGGSHYSMVTEAGDAGELPHVDLQQAPKIFRAVHACIKDGLLRSCHDLSEGGLAVALAEMAFAGGLGALVSLDALAGDSRIDDQNVLLFSESTTRFLVEVPRTQIKPFLQTVTQTAGAPPITLGAVTADGRVQINFKGHGVLNEPIQELKECWQRPLRWE